MHRRHRARKMYGIATACTFQSTAACRSAAPDARTRTGDTRMFMHARALHMYVYLSCKPRNTGHAGRSSRRFPTGSAQRFAKPLVVAFARLHFDSHVQLHTHVGFWLRAHIHSHLRVRSHLHTPNDVDYTASEREADYTAKERGLSAQERVSTSASESQ